MASRTSRTRSSIGCASVVLPFWSALRADGAAPYASLIEALRPRVRALSVPTQTLRAVLTAAPGVAAPLPEVAAHRECAPAVMPQDTRLQRDVVHALATVCAGQPTALQLDDLHDADEATLAVVRDLVWIGFPAGLLRSTIAPAR